CGSAFSRRSTGAPRRETSPGLPRGPPARPGTAPRARGCAPLQVTARTTGQVGTRCRTPSQG
ncbi:MAG: hypothetical protein AVDCRST_MAG07-920, partial [uncultured Frankineae bacterium]